MKKFVFALLFVLGICVLAASCEKEDESSIVGKWGAEKYECLKNGKKKSSVTYDYRASDVCFTFTDKRQATIDLYRVGKDGSRECYSTTSTYILMGNSLMIGTTPYVITKLTRKELVIGIFEETETDEEESWYYLRRIE